MTAKSLHKLSSNPLCHISFIGTLVVPIISWLLFQTVFGWAKKIPISKKMLNNPHDMAFVALSGLLSNILQAGLWMSLQYYLNHGNILKPGFISDMLEYGVKFNIAFALLQMLPIPPFDMSYLLDWVVPKRILYFYRKINSYGYLIAGLLIYLGFFDRVSLQITPIVMNYMNYFLLRWIWV